MLSRPVTLNNTKPQVYYLDAGDDGVDGDQLLHVVLGEEVLVLHPSHTEVAVVPVPIWAKQFFLIDKKKLR